MTLDKYLKHYYLSGEALSKMEGKNSESKSSLDSINSVEPSFSRNLKLKSKSNNKESKSKSNNSKKSSNFQLDSDQALSENEKSLTLKEEEEEGDNDDEKTIKEIKIPSSNASIKSVKSVFEESREESELFRQYLDECGLLDPICQLMIAFYKEKSKSPDSTGAGEEVKANSEINSNLQSETPFLNERADKNTKDALGFVKLFFSGKLPVLKEISTIKEQVENLEEENQILQRQNRILKEKWTKLDILRSEICKEAKEKKLIKNKK